MQCVRDRYPALFSPAANTMQLSIMLHAMHMPCMRHGCSVVLPINTIACAACHKKQPPTCYLRSPAKFALGHHLQSCSEQRQWPARSYWELPSCLS